MEVLPKAIYNQQTDEIEFYHEYFNAVSIWATDIDKILERGYQEASQFGLGIVDAFHIAAAVLVGAEEFITNEKPEKSIHRTPSIKIISIHPKF
jgi:predicted nucleic acid-binding protein